MQDNTYNNALSELQSDVQQLRNLIEAEKDLKVKNTMMKQIEIVNSITLLLVKYRAMSKK